MTWNPDKSPWDTYADDTEQSKRKPVASSHSVARSGGIVPGDRAFLLRQGRERGIVASGRIASEIYPEKHWDGSGKITNYCDVEFETILTPDERLPIEVLQQALPRVHWQPQQSGTEVHPPADGQLERLWREHLKQTGRGPSARPVESTRRERTSRAASRGATDGPLGVGYRPAAENVASRARDPWTVDPDVVDRGLRGHRATQNAAAQHLRDLGIEPRSPRSDEPAFDLAWVSRATVFVAEVKSLTARNEEQQLRLGLGQALRYRQLLRNANRQVEAYLIVEREPADLSWASLCDALGVVLTWPSLFAKTHWRREPRRKSEGSDETVRPPPP